MEEAVYTKTVKNGKSTYFFDVKEAKNAKKYLVLSSSSPSKEDPTKYTRKSILVFSDVFDRFMEALTDVGGQLK